MRLPDERRAQWRADTAARFGLDPAWVADLEARRWHYRLFRGRYVSLHPTRANDEIREAYGDRRYAPLGRAVVEARVTGAEEAMFLPAVYRVGDVHWHEGGPGPSRRSWPSRACTRAPRRRASGSSSPAISRGSARARLRLVVGSGFLPDGGSLRVVDS